MRKYVPLFEDLEIPDDFTENDLSADNIVYKINIPITGFSSSRIVEILANVLINVHMRVIKEPIRSCGIEYLESINAFVMNFYSTDPDTIMSSSNWDTEHSDINAMIEYFKENGGMYQFKVMEDDNIALMKVSKVGTLILVESLEIPAEFTEDDLTVLNTPFEKLYIALDKYFDYSDFIVIDKVDDDDRGDSEYMIQVKKYFNDEDHSVALITLYLVDVEIEDEGDEGDLFTVIKGVQNINSDLLDTDYDVFDVGKVSDINKPGDNTIDLIIIEIKQFFEKAADII
jgi:hypothetical protein